MMTRDYRRRRSSRDSSRRRRRERRDSRSEQLVLRHSQPQELQQMLQQEQREQQMQLVQREQHIPMPLVPYDPRSSETANNNARRRSVSSSDYSSSFSSSSTNSSLLDISRQSPPKRFGFKSFFSRDSERKPPRQRRVRKKRSTRFVNFSNSSSSSLSSNLAYGRGYIERRRSREFSPGSSTYRSCRRGSDNRERLPAPRPGHEDEEIRELGRKFAEIARKQNREDMRAAGRHRPSALVGAATALSHFHRSHTGERSERGLGSSKPRRDSSSDDSEWESASEDESSSEFDSGLAYGSSPSLPRMQSKPELDSPKYHSQASDYERTHPQKPAMVDPRLFGPVNSLRGIVNTPCGFDEDDRRTTSHRYEPSVAPSENFSYDARRPMQQVYPVPTSDPARFDAGRSSIASTQDLSRSRPAPVPLQQPKPIAPISSRVYDAVESESKYPERSSSGKTLAGVAVAGVAGAVLASALSSEKKDDREKYRGERRDDRDGRNNNEHHRGYDDRRHLRQLEDGVMEEKAEKRRTRDYDVRDDKHNKRRGKVKEEFESDHECEQQRRRRDKYRDDMSGYEPEYRDQPRRERKEERRSDRREERKEDRRSDRKENRKEEPREEKRATATRSSDVDSYRRVEDPNHPSSIGPIDPFQFQVEDDAFATPVYSTPKRPLTPMVVTVDREPDFSHASKEKDDAEPRGRSSRRDSFEIEQDLQKTIDTYDRPKGTMAPPQQERGRSRSRGPDLSSQTRSRRDSPQRDVVLEQADQWYRDQIHRRRAEEDRSRSVSPEKSVVDKWKDDWSEDRKSDRKDDRKPLEIVEPHETPKKNGLYDAPDADVRIDNFWFPRDLTQSQAPGSPIKGRAPSVRDPSAERSRPMLNLVRPTPIPSPLPEKQNDRAKSPRESRKESHVTVSKSEPKAVTETREKEQTAKRPATPTKSVTWIEEEFVKTPATPAKSVTWGENEMKRYVVDSSDKDDDSSGGKVIIPAQTPKSRSGRRSGWDILASAVRPDGSDSAVSSTSELVKDKNESRKHVESPKNKEKSRRWSSSVPYDEIGDEPPIPGPKPPSPRRSKVPGAFAEDPDFTATVAAGLQDTGFDPNIVINDASYHRRNSPPRNDESSWYFAQTVSDIGIQSDLGLHGSDHGSVHGSVKGDATNSPAGKSDISTDKSQGSPKLSKKDRRKARQDAMDKAQIVVVEEEPAETSRSAGAQADEFPAPKISKKEQKKLDKAAQVKELQDEEVIEINTPREPEPEPMEATAPTEWDDASSSKKKPKKSKKAIIVQEDGIIIQGDHQRPEVTANSSASVPADSFRDVQDTRDAQPDDQWGETSAKGKQISTRDFESYEPPIVSVPPPAPPPPPPPALPLPEKLVRSRSIQYDDSVSSPHDEVYKPKRHKRHDSIATDATAWSTVTSEFSFVDAPEERASSDWDEPAATSKKSKKKKKAKRGLTANESSSQSFSEVVMDSPNPTTGSFSNWRFNKSAPAPEDGWETTTSSPKSKKKKSKKDSEVPPEAPKNKPLDEDKPPDRERDPVELLEGDPIKFLERNPIESLERDIGSMVSAPSKHEDGHRSNDHRSRSKIDDVNDEKSAAFSPDDSERKEKKSGSKSEKSEKSEKEKRNSAGTGFFGRFKSSIGIVDEKDKKDEIDEKKDDKDKSSFLANADTLGAAGVGLAGLAALTSQATSPMATGIPPEEKEALSTPIPNTPGRRSPGLDSIDPEIAPREIRPAIDPQYGDLLPLPPSTPGSPTFETDELPALPDSRPGTPEPERQLRQMRDKPSHIRRKSLHETPLKLKSPSQSAIPLTIRFGQRSIPSSPATAHLRSSPMASPATATPPDHSSVFKPRPNRPTSWDSSREFKPLYLVERTSRDSFGAPTGGADELLQLPGLPPSEPSSRESPSSSELTRLRDDDVVYHHARDLSKNLALQLDIAAGLTRSEPSSAPLGSEENTPKAEFAPRGVGDIFVTPPSANLTGEFGHELSPRSPPDHVLRSLGEELKSPGRQMSFDDAHVDSTLITAPTSLDMPHMSSTHLTGGLEKEPGESASQDLISKTSREHDTLKGSSTQTPLGKGKDQEFIPESRAAESEPKESKSSSMLGTWAGLAAGVTSALLRRKNDEHETPEPKDVSSPERQEMSDEQREEALLKSLEDPLPMELLEEKQEEFSPKRSKKGKKSRKGKHADIEFEDILAPVPSDDVPGGQSEFGQSRDLPAPLPVESIAHSHQSESSSRDLVVETIPREVYLPEVELEKMPAPIPSDNSSRERLESSSSFDLPDPLPFDSIAQEQQESSSGRDLPPSIPVHDVGQDQPEFSSNQDLVKPISESQLIEEEIAPVSTSKKGKKKRKKSPTLEPETGAAALTPTMQDDVPSSSQDVTTAVESSETTLQDAKPEMEIKSEPIVPSPQDLTLNEVSTLSTQEVVPPEPTHIASQEEQTETPLESSPSAPKKGKKNKKKGKKASSSWETEEQASDVIMPPAESLQDAGESSSKQLESSASADVLPIASEMVLESSLDSQLKSTSSDIQPTSSDIIPESQFDSHLESVSSGAQLMSSNIVPESRLDSHLDLIPDSPRELPSDTVQGDARQAVLHSGEQPADEVYAPERGEKEQDNAAEAASLQDNEAATQESSAFPVAEASQAAETSIPDEPALTPKKSKKKKKGKKQQALEPEVEAFPSRSQEQLVSETMPLQEAQSTVGEAEATPTTADEPIVQRDLDLPSSIPLEAQSELLPPMDMQGDSNMDIESPALATIEPKNEDLGYLPSAANLYPQGKLEEPVSGERSYFPSALAMLPVVGSIFRSNNNQKMEEISDSKLQSTSLEDQWTTDTSKTEGMMAEPEKVQAGQETEAPELVPAELQTDNVPDSSSQTIISTDADEVPLQPSGEQQEKTLDPSGSRDAQMDPLLSVTLDDNPCSPSAQPPMTAETIVPSNDIPGDASGSSAQIFDPSDEFSDWPQKSGDETMGKKSKKKQIAPESWEPEPEPGPTTVDPLDASFPENLDQGGQAAGSLSPGDAPSLPVDQQNETQADADDTWAVPVKSDKKGKKGKKGRQLSIISDDFSASSPATEEPIAIGHDNDASQSDQQASAPPEVISSGADEVHVEEEKSTEPVEFTVSKKKSKMDKKKHDSTQLDVSAGEIIPVSTETAISSEPKDDDPQEVSLDDVVKGGDDEPIPEQSQGLQRNESADAPTSSDVKQESMRETSTDVAPRPEEQPDASFAVSPKRSKKDKKKKRKSVAFDEPLEQSPMETSKEPEGDATSSVVADEPASLSAESQQEPVAVREPTSSEADATENASDDKHLLDSKVSDDVVAPSDSVEQLHASYVPLADSPPLVDQKEDMFAKEDAPTLDALPIRPQMDLNVSHATVGSRDLTTEMPQSKAAVSQESASTLMESSNPKAEAQQNQPADIAEPVVFDEPKNEGSTSQDVQYVSPEDEFPMMPKKSKKDKKKRKSKSGDTLEPVSEPPTPKEQTFPDPGDSKDTQPAEVISRDETQLEQVSSEAPMTVEMEQVASEEQTNQDGDFADFETKKSKKDKKKKRASQMQESEAVLVTPEETVPDRPVSPVINAETSEVASKVETSQPQESVEESLSAHQPAAPIQDDDFPSFSSKKTKKDTKKQTDQLLKPEPAQIASEDFVLDAPVPETTLERTTVAPEVSVPESSLSQDQLPESQPEAQRDEFSLPRIPLEESTAVETQVPDPFEITETQDQELSVSQYTAVTEPLAESQLPVLEDSANFPISEKPISNIDVHPHGDDNDGSPDGSRQLEPSISDDKPPRHEDAQVTQEVVQTPAVESEPAPVPTAVEETLEFTSPKSKKDKKKKKRASQTVSDESTSIPSEDVSADVPRALSPEPEHMGIDVSQPTVEQVSEEPVPLAPVHEQKSQAVLEQEVLSPEKDKDREIAFPDDTPEISSAAPADSPKDEAVVEVASPKKSRKDKKRKKRASVGALEEEVQPAAVEGDSSHVVGEMAESEVKGDMSASFEMPREEPKDESKDVLEQDSKEEFKEEFEEKPKEEPKEMPQEVESSNLTPTTESKESKSSDNIASGETDTIDVTTPVSVPKNDDIVASTPPTPSTPSKRSKKDKKKKKASILEPEPGSQLSQPGSSSDYTQAVDDAQDETGIPQGLPAEPPQEPIGDQPVEDVTFAVDNVHMSGTILAPTDTSAPNLVESAVIQQTEAPTDQDKSISIHEEPRDVVDVQESVTASTEEPPVVSREPEQLPLTSQDPPPDEPEILTPKKSKKDKKKNKRASQGQIDETPNVGVASVSEEQVSAAKTETLPPPAESTVQDNQVITGDIVAPPENQEPEDEFPDFLSTKKSKKEKRRAKKKAAQAESEVLDVQRETVDPVMSQPEATSSQIPETSVVDATTSAQQEQASGGQVPPVDLGVQLSPEARDFSMDVPSEITPPLAELRSQSGLTVQPIGISDVKIADDVERDAPRDLIEPAQESMLSGQDGHQPSITEQLPHTVSKESPENFPVITQEEDKLPETGQPARDVPKDSPADPSATTQQEEFTDLPILSPQKSKKDKKKAKKAKALDQSIMDSDAIESQTAEVSEIPTEVHSEIPLEVPSEVPHEVLSESTPKLAEKDIISGTEQTSEEIPLASSIPQEDPSILPTRSEEQLSVPVETQVEQQPETISEQPLDSQAPLTKEAEDDLFPVSPRRSKKKDKKKARVSLPLEPEPASDIQIPLVQDSTASPPVEDSVRSEPLQLEIGGKTVVEESAPTGPMSEELPEVTPKRSKKDKKKKGKSTTSVNSEPASEVQTPSIQEMPSAQDKDVGESQPAVESTNDIVPDTIVDEQAPAPGPVDDDTGLLLSKEVEDKKGKSTGELIVSEPTASETAPLDLGRDLGESQPPLESSDPVIPENVALDEPAPAPAPAVEFSHPIIPESIVLDEPALAPTDIEQSSLPAKKSKKDKKKKKAVALGDSEPVSGPQIPVSQDQDPSSGPSDEQIVVGELSPVIVDEIVTEEPAPVVPLEDQWPTPTTKRSKKDKKKKKNKSTVVPQADFEPTSVAQTPFMQDPPNLDDSRGDRPTTTPGSLDPVMREPVPMEEPAPSAPVVDDWSEFGAKKPKEDKKREKDNANPAPLDVPSTSQETTAQEAVVEQQQSQSQDVWADDDYFKPKKLNEEEGSLAPALSIERQPSTPPATSSREIIQTTQELDMSPAEPSSHIDHERPFDQSTQPGKKARMRSFLGDTIIPEPIATIQEPAVPYLEDPARVTQEPEKLESPPISIVVADESSLDVGVPIPSQEPVSQPLPDNDKPKVHQDLQPKEVASSELDMTPNREIAASYLESHSKRIDDILPSAKQQELRAEKSDIPAITPRRELAASYFDPQPAEQESIAQSEVTSEAAPNTSVAEDTRDSSRGSGSQDDAKSAREIAASLIECRMGKKGKEISIEKSMSSEKGKEKEVDPKVAKTVEVEGSKKAKKDKGNKQSKHTTDKRTPKEDDIFDDPSLREEAERKTIDGGSRLDKDNGDFWGVPDQGGEDREEAILKSLDETIAHTHRGQTPLQEIAATGSDSPESPIVGRENLPTKSSPPSHMTKTETKQQDTQKPVTPPSSELMRDLDELDTSEPTRDQPADLSGPLQGVESIPSPDLLQSPVSGYATPHFGRLSMQSLPPVEEDPREDLEKDIIPAPGRLDISHTPEANRDSGFVADSPHPFRRSQGDDGQRDSGVHMRDWPENTPKRREGISNLDETGARLSSASPDDKSSPKSNEKQRKVSPLSDESPRVTPPKLAGTPIQGQRSVSDNTSRHASPRIDTQTRRSASNTSISRLRTPDPLRFRADSPASSNLSQLSRSSRDGRPTPPLLRRVDRRMSGDLRSISQYGGSHTSLSKELAKDQNRATQSTTPIANEGRVRARDMTDVFDGLGEGRVGSPRSPTRPHSMRRRQSMQVLELESKVEQLMAENRMLAEAKLKAENSVSINQRAAVTITERDAQIESLRAQLGQLQREVTRLREVNEGLNSANAQLAVQNHERQNRVEKQKDLERRFERTVQEKDAEIDELRRQLETTKEQVRELQRQILATKPPDADFLRLKDEDYFDHRCQQLCAHVQQWVLRFSKFSDMRACRLTGEINDEKIIDRLDNSVLDGTDVDDYLSDRVRRRDIFMSMTMNMVWEFVFTRYLFGMDREQRQKLKSLEKLLSEVGPPHAVRQWRAVTLTLLSRRPAFGNQRNDDTEAVVQAILQTLSVILPPPSNMEHQIQSQLRRVLREAVDLSIEMRTQKAEYMMLPPLQPEYDANGDLAETVTFNASLMNERSGGPVSNEELEAQRAIVRCVLFPLVVKKGDDTGIGDDEIVVCPAQVLIAKPRQQRGVTPSSDAGGVPLSRGATPSALSKSAMSIPTPRSTPRSQPEAEYVEGGI